MTAPDPHALLAEAEALAEKATPGPWDGDETGRLVLARTDRGDGYFRTEHIAEALDPSARRERGHNLALIAASRTLVPALCAALRQALAEVEQYRSEPLIKSIERILDEHSAWIARPSPEVTKAIALAAGIAGTEANRQAASEYERHLEAEVERLRAERDDLTASLLQASAMLAARRSEPAS